MPLPVLGAHLRALRASNRASSRRSDDSRLKISTLRGDDEAIAHEHGARQQKAMKLHGSLIDNLQVALASAKRLRGHPIHKDTVAFWRDLIAHARAEMPKQTPRTQVENLIAALEGEIVDQGLG
jgi:hypothetical protein